jgi:hypothetical protein
MILTLTRNTGRYVVLRWGKGEQKLRVSTYWMQAAQHLNSRVSPHVLLTCFPTFNGDTPSFWNDDY